jgi:hypothetical protein
MCSGDLDKRFKEKCPRKLEKLPESWCPLAVMRLKYMKTIQGEISEDQETKIPGCPFYIANQLSNYCFFIYEAKNLDHPMSDLEIANLLGISVDAVKRAGHSGLEKIKNNSSITELKEALKGESCLDLPIAIEDELIY